MAKKNDFSTTFRKIGMRKTNAEKLVNYLIDKDIELNGNVLLTMLGAVQMYDILIEKCSPNAKIIIADSELVTDYFTNYKNITCINIKENDADDFYNKLKNMPKFDFVVQNPPYKGSLHLDFFKKGYEMLSNKGQMIIIEPAMWLINLNENSEYNTGKRGNLTPQIKNDIKEHVKKIVIENYNGEFNTTNTVPFSITHIDKGNIYNTINYTCCGIHNIVSSIYDCNHIGKYDLIKSIFNKIKKVEPIKNHTTNKQSSDTSIYYLSFNDVIYAICGVYFVRTSYFYGDTAYFKHKLGDFFKSFISPSMNINRNDITNIIPKKAARGGSTSKEIKLTDKPANCVYGTKTEIENYKYFISNNSLPLFINMCLSVDQNNNSLSFMPWLVDKKYTDQEIYKKFNFTDDEIKLIEMTVKKFEHHASWFKRYMCGPSEVTDEEVQKFMKDLNNAKG